MANLLWIGGGSNRASNPNDWIDRSTNLPPDRPPQPGDTLTVATPIAGPIQSFTMNVIGSDLAGDPVRIGIASGPGAILTANLSHKAVMTAVLVESSVGTFNLSPNSTFDLSLTSGAHVGINSAVVNMTGNNDFTLNDTDSLVAVNLSDAKWNGTFNMGPFHGVSFGHLTVNGDPGSAFNNNGHSVVVDTEQATINTAVIGKGSFDVANRGGGFGMALAKLEFVDSVGPNQSVSDSGLVVIDQPNKFDADITLTTSEAPTFPLPAEIDLMNLATADGYTYENDMLNILSGSKVIDTLRLHDSTLNGFTVNLPTQGSSVVSIVANIEQNPVAGLPNLTGV